MSTLVVALAMLGLTLAVLFVTWGRLAERRARGDAAAFQLTALAYSWPLWGLLALTQLVGSDDSAPSVDVVTVESRCVVAVEISGPLSVPNGYFKTVVAAGAVVELPGGLTRIDVSPVDVSYPVVALPVTGPIVLTVDHGCPPTSEPTE